MNARSEITAAPAMATVTMVNISFSLFCFSVDFTILLALGLPRVLSGLPLPRVLSGLLLLRVLSGMPLFVDSVNVSEVLVDALISGFKKSHYNM